MRHFAISGYPHCEKCGISNTLATALLTKRFVGPGTFLVGLELYEVAGPAGLDLIKLKIGHCLQGIWLIRLIRIFCYFNYIQILSIYEHSRDQDSLLLTWISNPMPSVGLNYLFIPKLQVLHFRARYSDSIFGLDIWTRYLDSIFGRDIWTRFSDLILRLDFRTWILNSDKLLHPAHYNGCNYRVATEFIENSSLTACTNCSQTSYKCPALIYFTKCIHNHTKIS